MKVLAAGSSGLLALIVLAVAIASSGGAGTSGLSPALAAAPPGLVAVAFQSGPATGIDPNVLLAIAKVETDWGQARNGQPDDLVPDDIRARAAAKPLFERVLAIFERVLGPDHPNIGDVLSNLAYLLYTQGELTAAKPLLERAWAIKERALGPNHPSTANSLVNMAALLRDQGDPAAARPLFERALAIQERVLGPDHPDTVATRRALAELAAVGDGPAGG